MSFFDFEHHESKSAASTDASSLSGAYMLEHDLELTPDRQFVRWGRENKLHPRNWPFLRKCYDTGLVCFLDLIVTATSTAGASSSTQAGKVFGIGPELSTFCFVTVFLLGQVVGTIVFPPWSEAFGRKRLYVLSSGLSSVCCVVVGVTDSIAAVVIGRVLGGFLAAIPYTVGSGSIEDMWNSRERIWVFFFWTIASNIGLCVGPIIGTFVTASLSWRWVFYIYAMIIGAATVLFFFMRESRPALLLAREVEKMCRETGEKLEALNHDHMPEFRSFVRMALFRPAALFVKEPLVLVIALMIAFAFGLLYIFTEALQPIYESMGFSTTHSSLAFVAIATGIWFSSLTRILDFWILDNLHRKGQPVKPEHKLAGLAIGAPVLAISMWWFGWTIPPHVQGVHWIVPTIPLAMMGYSLNEFDTVLYGYLGDSYLSYSASATAAVAFLRALLSGVFPLFTNIMFRDLTPNVAMSVLAALATVFCAAPLLFIRYGERIRARSKFAKHSLQIQAEIGNKDL